MKEEFRAFPSSVVEIDGEITPSYRAGNNNEPKYPKYDTIHGCVEVEYVEDEA